MSQEMPWVEDVARGAWMDGRLDDPAGPWTIHHFVPRGFPAYARVLHPLHPGDDQDAWRCEGRIPAAVLGPLATHLAACTTTPGAGVVGVWEGIGGLVSSAGRATFWLDEPEAGMPQRYAEVPRRRPGWRRLRVRLSATRARPGRAPRSSELVPGTGILAADAASGPRLELPDRNHVLFEAGIDRFADDAWIADAPWLDELDRANDDPQTQAIVWPADHAWVVANDTDDAWTYVAGSRALVDALVADPRLEAYEIPERSVPDYPERAC